MPGSWPVAVFPDKDSHHEALMSSLTYLDFDLSIETISPNSDRYRARVLNSPAGQASTEFALPFSELELGKSFLYVGRPRRGRRAVGSPDIQTAQTFGSTLLQLADYQ